QREVGLQRRADVEVAIVEERPAAVLVALDAAEIDADLALQLRIDRLAAIMPQQDVFGRNSGIGFQFVAPVAIRLLRRVERFAGGVDGATKLVTDLGARRR